MAGMSASEVDRILKGWEWNELPSEHAAGFHRGLLTLLAFEPNRTPHLVGTAFIVASDDDFAYAVTAAHNFHEGIMNAQNPKRHRHPSALPEFSGGEISLEPEKLRAIYRNGTAIEAAVVESVAWEKKSDLAVLKVVPQGAAKKLFGFHFALKTVDPSVGDLGGMIGYGNMATADAARDGEKESFAMGSRLVVRAGTVTKVYPDGHSLVRTLCIETTIPVFSGMSGGPVFLMPEPGGELVPFGLISHDPSPDDPEDDSQKYDRSKPGGSIAAFLPTSIVETSDDKRLVGFHFTEAQLVGGPD